MDVKIGIGRNIDRPDLTKRMTPKKVPCNSLAEASRIVREFIETEDIGGGQFLGGQVYEGGKIVARVSYNGRVWDPEDHEIIIQEVKTEPIKEITAHEAMVQLATALGTIKALEDTVAILNKQIPEDRPAWVDQERQDHEDYAWRDNQRSWDGGSRS